MTFMIHFGWWMLPAGISVASVLWVILWRGFLADAGSDIASRAVSGLLDLLVAGALLIVCLIAWLIWALLA